MTIDGLLEKCHKEHIDVTIETLDHGDEVKITVKKGTNYYDSLFTSKAIANTKFDVLNDNINRVLGVRGQDV
jgi:hypothetical protein